MAKGDTTITRTFMSKIWFGLKRSFFSVTLDNYKTGGWSFDTSNLGSGTVRHVAIPPTIGGYPVEYDYTNKKIKAYKAVATEMDDNDATQNGVAIKVVVERVS